MPTLADTIGATASVSFIAAGQPTQQDENAILEAIETNVLSLLGSSAQVRDFLLTSSTGRRRQVLSATWVATFRVTASSEIPRIAGGGSAELATQIASSLEEQSFADVVTSTTSSTVDTASITTEATPRSPLPVPSPSRAPTISQPLTPSPVAAEVARDADGTGSDDGNVSSASSVLMGVLIPLGLVVLFIGG
jgi:hypothetical protein